MNSPAKHIAFFVNPTRENEKALRIANTISVLLDQKKIPYTFFIDNWPDRIEGFTEAWISGGDGTINWFINRYPQVSIPLALFPGGSGNDFHWMLYNVMSLQEQVERVLQATPGKVDAGSCNGHLFLNGVGIGFDGAIVKELLGKKKLAGKASYLLAILKHIIGYQEKSCRIEMPEETIEQTCFLISVANARRYGGGFMVAPRASLHDGLLDINISGRIPPLKRIKYLPVIEKGEHLDLPFIAYRQADRLMITAAEKLHTHIDGEYIFESQFDLTVLPERFSFLY